MKLFKTLTIVALVLTGLNKTSALADKPEETAKLDRLLVKAQKICPVSGQELGNHGKPIKAKVGKQSIFLCCKGCFGRKISRENWTKVIENLVRAQQICPVMQRPLPKNLQLVVVKRRIVFVCCKPCIKKVQSKPNKYLAIVNQQLKQNVSLQK